MIVPISVFGQSAGAFSRMGMGARGMSMGNAMVADAFGFASPYYNPALAPFVDRQNLVAAYTFLSLDRELQFLQFAVPLRPQAGVSAGLIHAGVSNIDGRDASGLHTQDYSIDEFAGYLAFGTKMGSRLSAGIMFRFYYADLLEDVDPARGIGLSLGLSGRITDQLYIGIALDDLLSQYEWDTSSAFGDSGRKTIDQFPLRLRLGGSYRFLENRIVISAEYESMIEYAQPQVREVIVSGGLPQTVVRTDTDELKLHSGLFRVGGEWWLMELFALRAGLDRIFSDEIDGLSPSLGFMVQQDLGQLGAQFEYAFRRESYATGLMHMLSIRLNL